jgi:FMN-dependent NADH-azoreductase
MKRVLIVDCCIRREQSRTRRILDAFRAGLDPETCQQQYLCLMDEDLKPLTGSFFEERQQLLEQNDLEASAFPLRAPVCGGGPDRRGGAVL